MPDPEFEREDRRYLGAEVIVGLDKDDGVTPREIYVHPTVRGFPILSYVYNPDTLAWERMRQPVMEFTGDLTVTMGDVEKLLAGEYFKTKKFAYSGNNIIYRGHHVTRGAATDDENWRIYRYLYSGNNITDIEGPEIGSWDDRATLWS